MRGSGVEVRPRVAVVGAGIGGLALAAVLAASGTRCEVFEESRGTGGHGAGVQLAPNAVRPLRRLGLGPVLRAAAVRMEAAEIRGWDGRPVARLPLGDACERLHGAPYYAVRRAELHAALLERVPAERVHDGKRLHRLDEDADGVSLHFEDGTTHRAEVVVGADGVRSAVRSALRTEVAPAPPRFSGFAVHHGLLPVERLPRALVRDAMIRSWAGPGAHLLCFPVSGGSRVSFTATVAFPEESAESWCADGDPRDLVREFGHWQGMPSQIVSAVRTAGSVRRWGLYERPRQVRWSTDRVTLLGDAAHPGLVFTSQGTSQAVEDAFDLAVRLSGALPEQIPAALAAYESLRAPRIAEVERELGEDAFLRLPDGAGQRERDAAVREATTLRSRAGVFCYDAGRRPEQHGQGRAVTAGQGLAGVGRELSR